MIEPSLDHDLEPCPTHQLSPPLHLCPFSLLCSRKLMPPEYVVSLAVMVDTNICIYIYIYIYLYIYMSMHKTIYIYIYINIREVYVSTHAYIMSSWD